MRGRAEPRPEGSFPRGAGIDGNRDRRRFQDQLDAAPVQVSEGTEERRALARGEPYLDPHGTPAPRQYVLPQHLQVVWGDLAAHVQWLVGAEVDGGVEHAAAPGNGAT